jgi:hypothetical protein
MRNLGLGLVVCGLLSACSKTQPSAGTTAVSVAASAVPPPAPSLAAAPPAATSAPAPVAPAPPAGAPASFKTGNKETIGAAVGLGCEATSLDGWLQLLCRKKNGTGGHPVRAVVKDPGAMAAAAAAEPAPSPSAQAAEGEGEADAGNPDELTPSEQGELTIVVPFSGDEKRDVEIEWTDTKYTLHVTGAKATFEWAAAGIPHRRACQQLLDENKAVIAAAQKAEGEARLTTTEAAKLPRFGSCREGGLGSWALSLKAVSGKGEGATRLHHFELEVVRIAVDGTRKSASFGSVEAAPGGFELGTSQVYDYDDDGRDELIVPYEIKATAGSAPSSYPAPIWAFNDSGVVPYAKAPSVNGGIGIEQLDFDMRPDFGTYGPFVAFLGASCGAKSCPPRVTGPKFYLHSTPEGAFTGQDDAAKSALKRAMCQGKPASVVIESASALNVAQTAKNLVCARAYGATPETLAAELTAKHAALCGEAESCPLQTTLEAWLKLELPVELPTVTAKK